MAEPERGETLLLVCGPGTELAVEREARALSLETRAHETGFVQVRGPPGAHLTANLRLRCCNRVRLKIADLDSPPKLARLELKRFFSSGKPRSWQANGARSGLWEREGRRLWGAPQSSDDGGLMLHTDEQGCTVSIDTSGSLLHFRGYRQEIGRAPMRETLAASMLTLADFADEPLCDVMCGSGTLLIEAASMALGLSAGRMRNFAFESWPSFDRRAFEAFKTAQPRSPVHSLRGSDLNAGALGITRRNARRAEVLEHLTLERLDATRLTPVSGPTGLVVANLPYGKRVGEPSTLAELYRALGRSLSDAFKGWRFALLLEEGAEWLELPVEKSWPIQNGGIACQLVVGRLG